MKWDDLIMFMLPEIERGHLTLEEQEALLRKALKDELARATAHVTAPIGAGGHCVGFNKIMATAYRIVARVPHDADVIGANIIDGETDETWTARELRLLRMALHILVSPMSVSRTDALEALEELGGPINEGTIREARSHMLRGYAEAHRRAELLDSDPVRKSGRGVMALLDDVLIGEASSNQQPHPPAEIYEARAVETCATPAVSNSTPDDSIYAKPSDLRFSEIIEPVLTALEQERGWKKDKGQRLAVCERAAWICGDKPLRDWSAADAEYFARTVAKFPNKFAWGKLHKSGAMAVPFSEDAIPSNEGMVRSARTNNRDLSILQNVSRRLAKTHWKLKYGGGLEVDFLEYSIRVEDDPENPDRMPWTPEHLRVLYGLPLWHGSGGSTARVKVSGAKRVWMDAAYWLPLIATYTGIGREEGAGLEVDDFNFECEVPYVIVKVNDLRGLKTISRRRVMPLHPELLDLGLQGYVEAVAEEQGHQHSASTPIFPELWSDDAKHSAQGKKVPSIGGRRFYAIAWRCLADATHALMPLPETKAGKKADFHSQRTYNLSVLASPGVSQAILDRHMGHAAKGTGQKKYNRRMLALGEVQELKERRDIMVREMPNVSSHIPRQIDVKLLPLKERSRVGSAPGRDAQRKYCQ